MEELRFQQMAPEHQPVEDVMRWPHKFIRLRYRASPFDSILFRDVLVWCTQNFSGPDPLRASWGSDGHSTIMVRNEADALAFKMRWC